VLAVPCLREDVGSCCIVHIGKVCDSHVELDFIKNLVAGWLPILSHHDLVDGQIESLTWRNGSQGGSEQ